VFDAYYYFTVDFDEDPASHALTVKVYLERDLELWSILANAGAKIVPTAFDKIHKHLNTSDSNNVESITGLVPVLTGVTPLGLYSNRFAGTVFKCCC
jgi:hypothetical protein